MVSWFRTFYCNGHIMHIAHKKNGGDGVWLKEPFEIGKMDDPEDRKLHCLKDWIAFSHFCA